MLFQQESAEPSASQNQNEVLDVTLLKRFIKGDVCTIVYVIGSGDATDDSKIEASKMHPKTAPHEDVREGSRVKIERCDAFGKSQSKGVGIRMEPSKTQPKNAVHMILNVMPSLSELPPSKRVVPSLAASAERTNAWWKT